MLSVATMKLHCLVSVLSAFSFLVNKTKWLSGSHLVVLFFWLFYVQFLLFVFHSFQKKTRNPDTAKTPKFQNAEKRTNKEIS